VENHDPPPEELDLLARLERARAHLAKTCLDAGEQMRVLAQLAGFDQVEPQRSVFAPPLELEPHVFTDLGAWMTRVSEIDTLVRRNTSRAPITRRVFARTFRRPRQHRRTRPSGTRGSPAGSSRADDDPEPRPDVAAVAP
jgi:hypothetical protein